MKNLAKKITGLFLQGVLYATPIFIPIYILYSIFSSLDTSFKEWLGLEIPGLGLLSAFISLAVIGWFGKTFITQPIQHKFYSWLEKAPLIKVIYNSVKDLLKAFVGKEKKFTKIFAKAKVIRIDKNKSNTNIIVLLDIQKAGQNTFKKYLQQREMETIHEFKNKLRA